MKTIKNLQNEYRVLSEQNGWDKESVRDIMLLLTEEIGELARAVRKHEGIKRDGKFDVELPDELADVMIYLIHLANTVNVDLGDAVIKKIDKNSKK